MNNDRAMQLIERAMRMKKVRPIVEPFKEILDYVEDCEKQVARYKKQLDDYNKDEEIKKLNDEINELRRLALIIFTEKELADYEAFRDKHYAKCKNGSSYTIMMEGTGIGCAYKVKCEKCGEIEDITDIDSW